MKLSVVTICFNNLAELKRTVSSVLAQTNKEFEYLVIDGGSTDGCKEYIATTSGITCWVSEPDGGIYNAMNKGIKMASGDYVIFLNSGDTFYDEEVLARVLPCLGKADFYAGHYMQNRAGKMKQILSPRHLSVKFLLEGALMHQATFTRTSLLKAKGYDEELKIVSDWKFLFEEWTFHDRTYSLLDTVVSIFYIGGISTNKHSVCRRDEERRLVLDKLLPRRIQDAVLRNGDYSYDTYVEQNIHRALCLPPLKRDAKLLRNAFKFLLYDMFVKR